MCGNSFSHSRNRPPHAIAPGIARARARFCALEFLSRTGFRAERDVRNASLGGKRRPAIDHSIRRY